MAVPLSIAGFPDSLDPRFFQITDGEYKLEADMVPTLYTVKSPTQRTERWSSLTPMGLYTEFQGSIEYDGPDEGYEARATNKQFAKGVQIEWEIARFDQFNIIESRYKLLARSARQTRQVHAAATFINAFSADSDFDYFNEEGVALCSDSHTTRRSGVSTASGFDNYSTAAFSPTALKAHYIQFRKFKDDAGQPIDAHEATHVLGPVDLRDRAEEVFGTMQGLDTAGQDKNVVHRRYEYIPWIRLTDSNNYYLLDKPMMKENLFWFEALPVEFARVEDFDGVVAKYRGRMSYFKGRADWRWILGAEVS